MREADENQDQQYEFAPTDKRRLNIEALGKYLATLPADRFKALAKPSTGGCDPHHLVRQHAARELAKTIFNSYIHWKPN